MAFISVTETGDVSTQTWTDYSQKENTTEEIVTGGDDEGDEIIEQVFITVSDVKMKLCDLL